MKKLLAYHWPGNVRELQNVLKRIMILGASRENIDELFQPPGETKEISTNANQTAINPIVNGELLDFDINNNADMKS